LTLSSTLIPPQSTPRPQCLTRTEGTQRLAEYLTAQQAAREPREPRPPVPDSSDDDSTTPIAPRRPPSPPTPLNQPLPIPTPPTCHVYHCQVWLKKPTNQQSLRAVTRRAKNSCKNARPTLNSPNPLPRTKQRLLLSSLISKALPPPPGKGSISFRLTIEWTPSMTLKNASTRPMVIQTKSLTPSPKLERLFQGKHPFDNI